MEWVGTNNEDEEEDEEEKEVARPKLKHRPLSKHKKPIAKKARP